MQVLTVPFTAGQTKRFELSGKYFEIISSSGPVTVDFYDKYGSDSNGAFNILSGFYVEGDFSAFNIRSATAQTVEILVTGGKGGSRRQPGIVSVVDGAMARTKANEAGITTISVPAAVGFNSIGMLCNLANSGKNLIVSRIQASSSLAGAIFVRTHNVVTEGTLDGTPVSKLNQVLLTGFQCRAKNTAAQLIGVGVFNTYVQQNLPLIYDFKEPIVLGPGFCIAAQPFAVNQDIKITFEFSTEPA